LVKRLIAASRRPEVVFRSYAYAYTLRGWVRGIATDLATRVASCIVLCAVLLATAPALADDDLDDLNDLDDLMGGFDEEFDVSELEELEEEVPGWIAALPYGDEIYERVDLSGSIAAGAVYNYLSHTVDDGNGGRTDYGGLSRLDLDGFLQLDIQLPGDWQIRAEALGWYDFAYHIQGRSGYNGAVLDVYEWQVDSGEVYIAGPLHENLDITLGRKIVNWGRSDTFRVVDVVSPLDNKEPGLVDIEDLRRPQMMAKLDATKGPWSAQFLVIPEHRYDRLPPRGSEFIPDIFAGGALGGGSQISDRSDFTGTPGLAGKVDGRFSGWDFSIYGAYVDETSRIPQFDPATGLQSKPNKIGMLGAAGNATVGAWLAKAEIAWLIDTRELFFDLTPPGTLLNRERDRLDTMVGIEYYGPNQLTIALEVVNRHIIDHPGGLPGRIELTPQDNFETALRISQQFFRERLDVTLLGIVFGEKMQDGGIFRASADFELSDAWKVEGGWLVYFGGPRLTLGSFDSNDRLYAEIKYSF
jgi:hypothetical protein